MARDLKTPLSGSEFDSVKSYTTKTGRKICYVKSRRGSMREAPCGKAKKQKVTSVTKKPKRAPIAPLREGLGEYKKVK